MSKDEQLDADCRAAYRLVVQTEGNADTSLDSLLGRLVDGIERLTFERDEARAEVTRLLAALRGIADMPEYDQDDAHRLRDLARAALAGEVES